MWYNTQRTVRRENPWFPLLSGHTRSISGTFWSVLLGKRLSPVTFRSHFYEAPRSCDSQMIVENTLTHSINLYFQIIQICVFYWCISWCKTRRAWSVSVPKLTPCCPWISFCSPRSRSTEASLVPIEAYLTPILAIPPHSGPMECTSRQYKFMSAGPSGTSKVRLMDLASDMGIPNPLLPRLACWYILQLWNPAGLKSRLLCRLGGRSGSEKLEPLWSHGQKFSQLYCGRWFMIGILSSFNVVLGKR
jgi:hypothetical protein